MLREVSKDKPLMQGAVADLRPADADMLVADRHDATSRKHCIDQSRDGLGLVWVELAGGAAVFVAPIIEPPKNWRPRYRTKCPTQSALCTYDYPS